MKGHWKDYNPFSHSKIVQKNVGEMTLAQRIEYDLTHHKKTLLPDKRNLYGSLYKGDLNRHSIDKDMYMQSEEMQKKLYPTEEKQK